MAKLTSHLAVLLPFPQPSRSKFNLDGVMVHIPQLANLSLVSSGVIHGQGPATCNHVH